MDQYGITVTTTDSLQGWEIHQYLGLVSHRAVIGTGLLTEILSFASDMGGRRSGAYESKMEQIERDAISGLVAKTRRLGGNAVLGLRIDHDEISAGGKSLMMVTAVGTAAVGTAPPSQFASTPEVKGIPSVDVIRALIGERLREQIRGGDDWTEEMLTQVLEQEAFDLLPAWLTAQETKLRGKDPLPSAVKAFEKGWTEVFLRLPDEVAVDLAYDGLSGPPAMLELVVAEIERRNALDPDRLIGLLEGQSRDRLGVPEVAFGVHPPSYTPTVIASLRKLAEILPTAFPERPEATTKKGLLNRAMWSCAGCGDENSTTYGGCTCGRDRRGLFVRLKSPDEVAARLLKRVAVAEKRIHHSTSEVWGTTFAT